MGTFQQCPTDLCPSETSFYKSAALQLGGERRALSSVSAGVLRVRPHVHAASRPFLLPWDQDLQERYKQVGEGSLLLSPPSSVVAEVALAGNVSP